IALPQYRKVVEKTRLSEALINFKTIEDSVQRYILVKGLPSEKIYFLDFSDVELSGGEWDEAGKNYRTVNFEYYIELNNSGLYMEVYRKSNNRIIYSFYVNPREDARECRTEFNDIGRYICNYLEPQGWQYIEGAL
ncbi:MAG: hypothetical protein K6E94_04275, partial [Elusimicrobiaceae bacterium]|nr:hypothetical protein [Elusimicrobiaceae bacterium]